MTKQLSDPYKKMKITNKLLSTEPRKAHFSPSFLNMYLWPFLLDSVGNQYLNKYRFLGRNLEGENVVE